MAYTSNFKVVPYKIPRGNMAAYFPETNVLVPHNHFADRSRTPISKSIRVRVERADNKSDPLKNDYDQLKR